MNDQQQSVSAHVQTYQINSDKTNLKRKNNTMDVDNNSKQLRNNYYALLANNDYDVEVFKKFQSHVNQTQNNPKPIVNKQKTNEKTIPQQTAKNDLSNNINTENNKNEKVPPINIFDIGTKQLIDFIKDCLKIEKFKIKETKQQKTLFMTSLADYIKVRAYLEKSKTKFYTFTPKSLKTKSYLLKGLEADIDTNEILEELNKSSGENLQFIKVSPFSTKKSSEEGYKLPIFMVQISPNSSVVELKNIRTLLYRCVKWEQVRRPEILQCRNCQGFFHSAANCFLQARCVKCNQKHEKGKCSLDKTQEDNRENLFCVLCNKFGHPSSYKGCEVYKKLQQKLLEKKNNSIALKNRVNISNNANIVNPNLSFANVLKGNTNNSTLNSLHNEANTNSFFEELKNLMSTMCNQINNLEQQLQKQSARIDAIFSIVGI